MRDNRVAAALAFVATGVLTVGILVPFISMSQLGVTRTFSLIGGIRELYARGYLFLGSILLLFSVVFPYAKLLAILSATSALVRLSPARRLWLHRFAAFTGRYSLLDILVVAVMIVVIRFEAIAEARALAGTVLFAAAVFLSVAAGFCFDPGSLRRGDHG